MLGESFTEYRCESGIVFKWVHDHQTNNLSFFLDKTQEEEISVDDQENETGSN